MAGVIVENKDSCSTSHTMDYDLENLNRRPAQTLQLLAREKIVEMALVAVNRIQTGLKNSWLGWPLQFLPNLPNFEPKVT
jgi:hypothetical protein